MLILLVSPAQFLSETMLKYNLTVNELFDKMGFGKSTYLLDRKMLTDGFRKVDSTLTEETINKYVETILDGNVFVELDDLSEIIDSQYGIFNLNILILQLIRKLILIG